MGTVYVTQEEAFICKVDERLNVKVDKKTILDVPLIKVDGVVIFGRATVSPAAIAELINRKTSLTFLNSNGKYLARLEPEMSKNIFLRSAQWKAAGESAKAVHVVRGFVRGKLKNYRVSLMRSARTNPEVNLDAKIHQIESVIAPIDKTNSIDSLRGLEGAGSAAYFASFDRLIRKANFTFNVRHRPATDPVNSLLNLGYTLLRHDIQSALNIVGFDPYLGYLHTERYGRPSLALDLMEEFRPLIVDAVVLTAINRQQLTPNDFTTEPLSNVVTLTKEGIRTFLRLYQEKKLSKFTHPVMKRQFTYQEAFEVQARLLGKYLMGEIDKYPPLVVK